MLTPIDVICPWCHAAIGVKCRERKSVNGVMETDFHLHRIVKAESNDTSTPSINGGMYSDYATKALRASRLQ